MSFSQSVKTTATKSLLTLNLQVAFGPVARELVLYRHRAPECSFHGDLPADWTPPNAATFCRCGTAYHTSLLASAAAVKLLVAFVHIEAAASCVLFRQCCIFRKEQP